MKRFLIFTFLVLFFSFSYAQLAKMSLTGKPLKAFNAFVGKRDPNGRFCAAIQAISDMDGFKYQSNNGIVAVDDQPGEDMVYLQPDERVLKIFHTGYEPLTIIFSEYGIQLHPKDVWEIKIKGQPKTGTLLLVTIFTNPTDAMITVDGKSVKSGIPVKQSKGNHHLRIWKERFKTKEQSILVDEKNVVFNFTLNELELQQVVINSTPTEAHIYLDSMGKGITDKGIFLYAGSYQLKLSKTGYLDVNKTITVTEDGNNIFNYHMVKNSGSLSLYVTPDNVSVLINKEEYTGRSNIELAPGMYKIELSKNGYYSKSEAITIKRDQILTKTYNLMPKTGTFQFSIQPLTAKVNLKLNGRIVQKWTGMKYFKDIQVGDYELKCSAVGYDAQSKKITINGRQTTIIDIKLNKVQDGDNSFVNISSYGMVKDIDGNVYKVLKIGKQVWMAENLRVTHYRNGDAIPKITKGASFMGIGSLGWSEIETDAYCYYENDSKNAYTYGLLYNWYAVNNSRNIAPLGWHVPTDEEWKQLEMYMGMSQTEANGIEWRGTNEGDKLKDKKSASWICPNMSATNESGFSVLPAGYRDYHGNFSYINYLSYFWSATEYNNNNAWRRKVDCNHSGIYRHYSPKRDGFSVRCIRD